MCDVNIMDALYGPTTTKAIMKKPEFSFLERWYYVLYQSLIPNSKLTVNVLKQQVNMPSEVEVYILSGENSRMKCHRVAQFLLVHLDHERCYMKFCYQLSTVSVLPDLPYKLITEFQSSCHWNKNVPNHPQLDPIRLQKYCRYPQNSTGTSLINGTSTEFDMCAVNSIAQCTMVEVELECRAQNCTVDNDYKTGRRRKATKSSSLQTQCDRLVRSKYAAILQSLPSDYEKTLHVVQDNLSDDQICVILSSPSYIAANELILNNLINKVKEKEHLFKFCNYLEQVALSSSHKESLQSIICDLRAVAMQDDKNTVKVLSDSSNNFIGSHNQPDSGAVIEIAKLDLASKIISNGEFDLLKKHYSTILHLMPDDYEKCVGRLQNYLTDDHICVILSSSNSVGANKVILDCLIERIRSETELLDFCDQLQAITSKHEMMSVINEIRHGSEQRVLVSQKPLASSNIPSSVSHYLQNTDTTSPFYNETFSRIKMDPGCKTVQVYKTYYTSLWKCLPKDANKNLVKLHKMKEAGITDTLLNRWRKFPSGELINEVIVGALMSATKSNFDTLMFCGFMEKLMDNIAAKMFINYVREELLATFATSATSIPPRKLMDTQPKNHVLMSASSVEARSSPAEMLPNPNQSQLSSKAELEQQFRYQHRRFQKGIEYRHPPPLPPNYVCREVLLDDIAKKLCMISDQCTYGVTVTLVGVGGFGKTTIITALCHHPTVQEKFKDGFLLIELGQQSIDPMVKLAQQYHLLTGHNLRFTDLNHAKQEIFQFTSDYCRNLLIIIDDVWYIKDAEPIVSAFSSCKIVLTSRMNEIDQHIPTKQTVTVGPMEQSEAIALLTKDLVSIDQLSPENVTLLHDLAQDVHLWPLLLCLVRGQLSYYSKRYNKFDHRAIQNVQAHLYDKGLTAFDKNSIGDINNSRKYAVQVCIDASLELLTTQLANRMKSFLLWTGMGTSLAANVLHTLWNISELEAETTIKELWTFGLVKFLEVIIPFTNDRQQCLEVHDVINQYIVESMSLKDILTFSPHGRLGTAIAVIEETKYFVQHSMEVEDVATLPLVEYLKFQLFEIENRIIPIHVNTYNKSSIFDPHYIRVALQAVHNKLMKSPHQIKLFVGQFATLMKDSEKVLRDVHPLNRKFGQKVQHLLYKKDYAGICDTIEYYCSNYPVGFIAEKGVEIINKIIPLCTGELLDYFKWQYEEFQKLTPQYHQTMAKLIPYIKFYVKVQKEVKQSLLKGSPYAELTYYYFRAGKYTEECEQLEANYLIKLQEVCPDYVLSQLQQYST
ncbi:uncharacterized protein [Dysidea avara]